MIETCPVVPKAVVDTYRRFLDRQEDQHAVASMRFLPEYSPGLLCWFFTYGRCFYGIEPDGHLHS
jgi:hypothetical protein